MKTQSILLVATLAIALAGCNNNENEVPGTNDSRATFSAAIEGQTRAYDQTWDKGDQIGITGTSGAKAYANVAYQTTAGNGTFTVATSGSEIYYQNDEQVNFTAYYPWNDLATGVTTISANTWGQKEQKTFDFLHATATGSKASPDVAFSFTHRMSKLTLSIKPGNGVSYEEVKAAKLMLSDYLHTGAFDITTGIATANTESTAAYWPFANAQESAYNAPYAADEEHQTVTYSLILFPQSFTTDKMEFDAELNQTFSADLDFTTANGNAGDANPNNELIAGRQYNLSVTLNKTSITVDGCTIGPWQEADGGNVDAN